MATTPASYQPSLPQSTTNTFAGALRRAVATAPQRCAAVCGDIRLTHDELSQRMRRLAGALRGLGLCDGDRVAVLSANCHRYLELYLAVPAAGFVLVPLNTRHTQQELSYALADAGARVLFTDRYVDGVTELVQTVVNLPGGYEDLLESASQGDWSEHIQQSTLAGIFYTGGTTGQAKGVMLTHGNLVANAFAFMSCWPFTAQTRWLVVAPMFHAAGTIATLATVWAGGEHVILPGFDAEATLDTIEREKVTATLVVPTMMSALSQAQDRAPRDVSSLRYLSHGSSPVAADVLRQTHASFPDAELLHIYGLTETSPIVTLLRNGESVLDTDRARSCGQPAIGVELRIADPQHQSPAPSGHVGEVQVRGLNVTPGYWGKPDATAQAFVDGWYATGDLGYLDAEGFLFLVDRVKDMIITGGENVYSTEVEQALYAHPAVSEAAVFGVPDTRWGEAVHALVYCTDAATSAELIEHCKVRIASYKIPKQIELAEQPLPKSGAGKILKRKLKDLYWPSR